MIGDIARRYWFADAAALDAIRAAEDAPEWEASGLPATIFCLDDTSHEALHAIIEEEGAYRIVDARDTARFADALICELDRETAQYLQFAFRAIEDFGPALELLAERLTASQAKAVQTELLAIGPYSTGKTGNSLPEQLWITANTARDAVRAVLPADARAVEVAVSEMAGEDGPERLTLVTGACYLKTEECPELADADREAALWRARTAAAWSEIDRLQSEKRVRAGREQALKARHERDLARQAERSAAEIDRLHRAAGWAGKWRARVARLFGR